MTNTTPDMNEQQTPPNPQTADGETELKERLNEPALADAPQNPHDRPEDSAAIAQANIDRPLDRDSTARMIADFKGKCQAQKKEQTPPVR